MQNPARSKGASSQRELISDIRTRDGIRTIALAS